MLRRRSSVQAFKEKTMRDCERCPDGKWKWLLRSNVPYFVSAQLSSNPKIDLWETEPADFVLGCIGAVLHVLTWVVLVAMEVYLMFFEYQDESANYWANLLSTCSGGSLFVTAIVVIVASTLHFFNIGGIDFNDGLLPPVVTSIILGGARSTLYFSQVLLLALIIRDGGAQTEIAWQQQFVAAAIFLKYLGVSMTVNNNRFKIYDDSEQPHYVGAG